MIIPPYHFTYTSISLEGEGPHRTRRFFGALRIRERSSGHFMYTPVQTGRLYQQIVDQIERRVLNGDLRHGDRLPTERELAEQFGVSRTVVREAMKALAQKGLIQVRPGRGTFVIDGTSQAMQHSLSLMMMIGQVGTIASLAEVREILEPEIAARAALRATEANIAAMQAAVATMDATLDDSDA